MREPVGVVGAITPWNYPLHQIAAKVAPALAAGCTVVLKPSEVAPLNAFVLAEILDEVGLPAGVFNLVTGTGPVVGEAIVAAPRHRHGLLHRLDARRAARLRAGGAARQARGARARRQVAERDPRRRRPREGGHRRRRQVLPQLGPDLQRADAHAGAARAARARPRQIAAAVAEQLHARRPVRRRTRSSARSSPTPSASACAATSRRAAPRAPSSSPAAPSRPTGSSRATSCSRRSSPTSRREMTIAQEEIFGPVLSIMPYDDEEDAVRIANDIDLRARRRRLVGRRGARQARGAADPHRARSRSTAAPSTRSRRSAATSSPATAASSAASASRSSSRSSRCSSNEQARTDSDVCARLSVVRGPPRVGA